MPFSTQRVEVSHCLNIAISEGWVGEIDTGGTRAPLGESSEIGDMAQYGDCAIEPRQTQAPQ